MFGFLGFGKKKKEQRDERQSEVIRVALNNVLRRRGIAPQSIGCEIEPMSRPGAADLMLVQLIIRKWNEGLMNDAPDLEAELFDVICLFSHSTRASDLLFVWKFAIDQEVRNEPVPEPAPVAASAEVKSSPPNLVLAPRIVAVPKVESPVKFDLPRTARDDSEGRSDHDFPATVIGH